MIKFEDLEKEIQTKLSNIGNVTIQKGSWDESSEEFKQSDNLDCYHVTVTKDISKGRIIKSISDFSKSDEVKSKFKKELVEILKIFKNKGCEIYMTHSSTHNILTYDIYFIKTKDIEEWYVMLNRSHWYDENGPSGYRAPRFWLNKSELNKMNNFCQERNWVMRKGEDISNELIAKSGWKWYNRIYGDRVNIGFYFISTKEYSGGDRGWNIAFVKISDDYFLVFFNPDFISNSYSLPDCLVSTKDVYYKCDQIEALMKCIDEHQF